MKRRGRSLLLGLPILPSAELQALYLEVSSTKRLPHLEWGLIGQLFQIVQTVSWYAIKSRRLNLLVLPAPRPIPLTSAGNPSGREHGPAVLLGEKAASAFPQVSCRALR